MTYSDLYDNYLDEMFQAKLDEIPPLMGRRVSRLIKDNAETDYNCGFNDWLDSLSSDKISCECGRAIDADRITDSCQEDPVVCGVCAGFEFECSVCGEVLAESESAEIGGDICRLCRC